MVISWLSIEFQHSKTYCFLCIDEKRTKLKSWELPGDEASFA